VDDVVAALLSLLYAAVILGPPYAACRAAHRHSRVAREGSVLRDAERQFAWAATVVVFEPFMVVVMMLQIGFFDARSGVVVLAIACVGKVVYVGVQLCLLLGLRRLAAETDRSCDARGCVEIVTTRTIDIGVGDAWHGRMDGLATYRGAPTLERLVVGDPRGATRVVRKLLGDYVLLHLAAYVPLVPFFVEALGYCLGPVR
jgi:hypothetical protein